MPARTVKQYGAMAAAAAGHSALGIPESVGKEFVKRTSKKKRSKFAKALRKRNASR